VIPVLALATGNNSVLRLFVQALFDDAFRFRWWHPLLWVSIVGSGSSVGRRLPSADLTTVAHHRNAWEVIARPIRFARHDLLTGSKANMHSLRAAGRHRDGGATSR
jgi:hypothetical protein